MHGRLKEIIRGNHTADKITNYQAKIRELRLNFLVFTLNSCGGTFLTEISAGGNYGYQFPGPQGFNCDITWYCPSLYTLLCINLLWCSQLIMQILHQTASTIVLHRQEYSMEEKSFQTKCSTILGKASGNSLFFCYMDQEEQERHKLH